jgi:hypothetical protein
MIYFLIHSTFRNLKLLHQMADFDDSSRTLSNESVLSEDSVISDDDLSPEQIDALLKRASDRMKYEQTGVARHARSVGKLPKLNSASLPPPYVRSDGQIARLEQKTLVSDAQRSLSEKPRKVVDPIVLRKESSRRGMYIFLSYSYGYEEILSQLSLDADANPILGVGLQPMRVFHIIVTLSLIIPLRTDYYLRLVH